MKKLLTVLLMLISPYAYCQLDTTNIGTTANDGTGESLRSAFLKVNLAVKQVNTNTDSLKLKLNKVDTLHLSNRIDAISSIPYPGTGIPLSNGSAWGTSITNNSTNWNTAYGWGNHSGLYDATGTASGLIGTHQSTYNHTNYNTAYTDRLKWDGGSTGLTAATGRSSLGGTTAGQALFTLTNPSAITFLRVNADNTVTALSAANFRTATATVGTADTLAMLTNYINKADTAAMLSKYLLITDTVGLGGGTSGIQASDTSLMLTPYITDAEAREAINDTLTARLSGATDLATVLDDYEPSLGNPTSDGYVLSSTSAGVRSWVQAGAGASYDSTYIHYRVDSLTTVVSNLQSELTSLIDAINRLDLGDITPPRFLSAEIGAYSDSIVVMLMDTTDILQDSVPLASHFALTEGGIGVGIDTVTINIDTVFIALDSTLTAGTTLLLDYTSGYPALQDSSGNKTVSWENKVVTNNITASAPSTLLTGLISYYSFDETSGTTTYDATSNNNDGTTNATVNQTGKIGKCYSYSSQNVDLGNVAELKPTSAMSISCWYKQYAYQGGIMGSYSAGSGYGLFTEGTGEVNFKLYSSWTTATIIGSTSVTTGSPTVWHHIVATWDGSEMKIYVDGSSDATAVAFTPDIAYNADNVFIGRDPISSYNCSENIDELGIWNRALTPSEITELYNSGNGKGYADF